MPRTPVLTPRVDDFPRWYQDVLAKAEIAEGGPVRGTQVIRPYGYALWERMQSEMDTRIKSAGARNAAFPLFIPLSYLQREAEHVEGFSPELAVVTHAGGKQLEEPVVVRPTSETVIGEFMAKWTSSYRDLPLLLNQWANVVRWELRPRLLLRSSEFLWQEGHTAHVTEQDAAAYARNIVHEVYEDFMRTVLAMPVIVGRKTVRERFAGATSTMTLEAMMGDGKALQMGTSHELGQNFARAFGIDFLDVVGKRQFAWTTSWGTSTRMLGGLIMGHGDDAGLRVPPTLAAVQVLVTAVKEADGVLDAVAAITSDLRAGGVRAEADIRTDTPFGRRAIDAELKGYPIRVEVGPRDLAEGVVVLVRRILSTKKTVPLVDLADTITSVLAADQQALYDEALARREGLTADVKTVREAAEAAAIGWARIPWRTLGLEGEEQLAGQGITVRCLVRPDGGVAEADHEDDAIAVVARAY